MIFINYRRDESMGMAGRLHDRLAQAFGRKNLFMDVDHIPPGVDFINHLNDQVAACDFFIAIIGPNWVNARNENGERRLFDPNDFVAIEVAAALARDIRVIPVLVDDARMPKASELPEGLNPLVRRHAINLRHDHFGRDAQALIEKIREAFGDKPVGLNRWRAAAGAIVALLLLGWIGLFVTGMPLSVPWSAQPDTREQAEKERLAAAKAEEERRAKAATEAEARARAEQAEKERLAAAKAEQERHNQAELEARGRSSALLNEGEAALNNRDNDRAIAAFNEAIRIDPKSDRTFARRGLAYARKGDNDRAITDFNEAIRLNPKNDRAFAGRGFVYARKGDEDSAIADLSEAIRLNPTDAAALYNRGVAYMKKGNNDQAFVDFNEAIRLNPTDARAFVNRSAMYDRKGDNDRALADVNEAIRLDPNYAIAFDSRGVANAKKGENDRAITDFNEAIRLDPKNASAFCNRGEAKLKINDASGNSDIEKARQLDASASRSTPAQLPAQQPTPANTPSKALEEAAAKGDAHAMFRLGLLYEHGEGVARDYAKAREWYEKAAAKGDAGAMNNLGVVYAS